MHKILSPFSTIITLSVAISKLVKKLMGDRLIDVAFHIPTRIEERHYYPKMEKTIDQQLVTLILKVSHYNLSRRPYSVFLSDGDHLLEVVYFKAASAYLKKIYPLGYSVLISGKIEHNSKRCSTFAKIVHPDFVGFEKDLPQWQGVKPIYPLTGGLHQSFVQRFVQKILTHLDNTPEWIDLERLARFSFPGFITAIKELHQPRIIGLPISKNPYKQRLCFDEFLAHQLSLILSSRRVRLSNQEKVLSPKITPLMDDFLKNLPFDLTDGQKKVIEEIVIDFQKAEPMVRLLQGDVGSGKTVVGFITSLYHIDKGGQVAFLAPTEILAQQHYENIERIFGHKIKVALLTGRNTIKQKKEIYKKLEDHQIDLLIGTHALIQEAVAFKNLTYCIIDEQHRFGVEQRVKLSKKGERVDLLSMTATPIPRSLTIAQYGDMDVSVLKEKPKGRKPIVTTVMGKNKYDALIDRLNSQLDEGVQVYWVCPLIEESSTFTAAQDRYEDLSKKFGSNHVGLVHGKMKSLEKDKVMVDFKTGNLKILVATTVIEVGVDVPNASIMIIENAERFGLAQLHQLRGRVGRGSKDSYCILLYGNMLTTVARQRLDIMRTTDDGFSLAEMDLKIRGSGELTGTQQSGMPSFIFSNFDNALPEEIDIYNKLMEEANAYAWSLALDQPETFKIACDYLFKIFHKNITFTQSG